MRAIAEGGAEAFYTGEIADDMIATLTGLGGVHTAEDFAAVKGMETTPVSGSYKGTELIEHPPNGQGATAILLCFVFSFLYTATLFRDVP